MILNINLMQNYSDNSVTANSSLPSPTGGVKSIPPIQENSIEMATTKTTTTTRAMRSSVRPITASTTRTPMTTFTQTLAWCTSCAELAHSAHSCTPGDVISHLIWLKSRVFSQSSMVIIMAHPLWLVSPFLLRPVPPCPFRLLPPLRAVLWARQPVRHGNPVPLRQ